MPITARRSQLRLITLAGAMALTACVDKTFAPRASTRAIVRFDATIAAQTTQAQSVDVYVSYTRTGGAVVRLATEHISASAAAQNVNISVDLAPCLADRARAAPLDACVLRVDAVLRDASNAVLDSVVAPTVSASPGATVTPPTIDLVTGTSVTVNYCPGAFAVIWSAYQDGTGTWKQIALSGGTGTFRMKSARGGIVWVRPNPTGGWLVFVTYAATSELAPAATFGCQVTPGTATISGAVSGIGATEFIRMTLGGAQAGATVATPTFSLPFVAPGLQDLIVARQSNVQGTGPTGVIIRRDNNVLGDATIPLIDLTTALPVESYPVTIVGGGTDNLTTLSFLLTARNRFAALLGTQSPGTSWVTEPASVRVATDLHQGHVSAITLGDQTNSRLAYKVLAVPAALTLTLGPALSPPTVTVVTTQPNALLRADVPVQSEYSRLTGFFTQQGSGTTARTFSMQMTEAYRQGATTAALVMPDLSSVAGWDNNWALKPGVSTSWSVSCTQMSGTIFQFPSDGLTVSSATKTGSITP